MRGQLIRTNDPGLLCNFPERMVLMANHQIYTDWLYLWWIGYTAGMHGRIYVVLKESLKKIPVLGWGMQFAQFIFLKRNWEQDKPGLAKHMQKLNQSKDPMWLMLFPEGTNLASCTREKSKKWADRLGVQDMKHTLLPRATGLHFMLSELQHSVDYVYDCTIAYEGVPHGTFAQDIFTVGASYFGGRPPKSVNMYWRRFKMNTIPLDDPKKFELWLRLRWREKDKFIDYYLQHGKFPADTGSNNNFKGESVHGAGHIEAEIRPKYWYEFMQVFAPIGVFALVLYFIYGSLPQEMVKNIKSIDQKTVMKQIGAIQRGDLKVPETKDLMATAPKDLQDRFKAIQVLAAKQNTTPEKIIAEAKKTLPAGALPAGDSGPRPQPGPAQTPKTQKTPKALKQITQGPASAPKATATKSNPSKAAAQQPTALPKQQIAPKKPLAARSGNTKGATAATKTKSQQDSKSKANSTGPVNLPATKLPGFKPTSGSKMANQQGQEKSGAAQTSPTAKKPASQVTKPAAAKSKKAIPAPKPLSVSVQENVPNEKEALRHALKKDAKLGKQQPTRKVRRALRESS